MKTGWKSIHSRTSPKRKVVRKQVKVSMICTITGLLAMWIRTWLKTQDKTCKEIQHYQDSVPKGNASLKNGIHYHEYTNVYSWRKKKHNTKLVSLTFYSALFPGFPIFQTGLSHQQEPEGCPSHLKRTPRRGREEPTF